jgi:hypothetical protein
MQVEMIGVAQYERGVDILEVFGSEELMRCGGDAHVRALVVGCYRELELKGNYQQKPVIGLLRVLNG